MEAAVLLPLVMLLFAVLAQPICLTYTRMVVGHAAAETVRVVATSGDEERARSYALRRLGAVPEASLFHVGGIDDWEVSSGRSDDGRRAWVEISGHARPLPFLGVLATAFSEHDGVGIVLRVRVVELVRPSWMDGEYGDWT